MLRAALCQLPNFEKRWKKARENGLGEHELRGLIRNAFGNKSGGLNVPGMTSVIWDAGYYPSFWFGPKVGAATVDGNQIVAAVRRVLQIPLPPPGTEGEEETAEAACRICDCTDRAGCSPEELDGEDSCWWVEDDLCSNPKCLREAGYTEEALQTAWKERGCELPQGTHGGA